MKVLVHACPDRMYYVEEFLIKSLVSSGVKKNDIIIFNDSYREGCLRSYLKSFKELPEEGDTWHLQDDVLPRKDFYYYILGLEYFKGGVINGFGNKEFYKESQFGYAHDKNDMFYSFPCIRIDNKLSHNFVEWFYKIEKEGTYEKYIKENKFVDYLFKEFIGLNEIGIPIFNFKPCLVEHVDETCGGSTINKQRPKPAKALYFNDDEAYKELRKWRYMNSQRRKP